MKKVRFHKVYFTWIFLLTFTRNIFLSKSFPLSPSFETEAFETLFETLRDSFEDGNTDTTTNSFKDEADKVLDFLEIRTGKGVFKGQINPYSYSFFAIKYAEAPIGEKRFMPPTPKTFSDEVVDAWEKQTIKCVQDTDSITTEDCLILNIHIPLSVSKESLISGSLKELIPVMFYIHGGAFLTGSSTNDELDGRFLSKSTNTIVVSLNYRLGALGSFYYKDKDIIFKGNQGFKDQQLALKWVKEEIKNFGGDSKKVTIFGNSAGAQSVMLHVVSSQSGEYFNRAIQQSNPAVYNYMTVEEASKSHSQFVGELGCTDKNLIVDCLRGVGTELIVEKTNNVRKAAGMRDIRTAIEPFRPIVDGEEFTEQPLSMLQNGDWNTNVDIIIGTNREEMWNVKTLFKGIPVFKSVLLQINEQILGKEKASIVTEAYTKLVTNPSLFFNYADELSQEIAHLYFVCPSRAMARFVAETSDSEKNFLYSWEHKSCDDTSKNCGHSCHTCEIDYVFSTREYTGKEKHDDDNFMSEMFSDFWGSFAHTGIPSSRNNDDWLKYEKLDKENNESWENLHMIYPRAKMESETDSTIGYSKTLCDMWDSLEDYVQIKEPEKQNMEETTAVNSSTTHTILDSNDTTAAISSSKATTAIDLINTTTSLVSSSTATDIDSSKTTTYIGSSSTVTDTGSSKTTTTLDSSNTTTAAISSGNTAAAAIDSNNITATIRVKSDESATINIIDRSSSERTKASASHLFVLVMTSLLVYFVF